MLTRSCLGVVLFAGLLMPFVGCGTPQVDTIQVTPATQALTVGQTAQFIAIGTYGHGAHPSTTQNVTALVTWTSSTPAIANMSSTGLATANSAGTTTITASMPGFTGDIAATATMTVTATGTSGGGGGGTGSGDIVALTIIPSNQAVAAPAQTSQFIAIGTTSSGATKNLTTQVAWNSSSSAVATISPSGLATGVGQGSVTITAIATNADNTVATAVSTFTVVAGAAEPITALSITPGAQSLSATGQTGQFIALGTSGFTGFKEDVTSSRQLTWSSSVPSIATISPTGLATGVSAGNTTITGEWTNPDGSIVSTTAAITVSNSAAPEPLLSLTIIPNSITVGNLQDTGQFLAIGTYSTAPTIRDLTNSPNLTWISSEPSVFPVNTNSGGSAGATAGIVTAYGNGSAVIIAEATNPQDGSIQTASTTFNCPLVLPSPTTAGTCYPGSQATALLAAVTVYNEGLNTTNWEVTAPSATGTANVIHCGPGWTTSGGTGGSVCVATYPINTTVILTAPAGMGAFGGWSSNCTPNPSTPTTAGPNQCTMVVTNSNVTVGAVS